MALASRIKFNLYITYMKNGSLFEDQDANLTVCHIFYDSCTKSKRYHLILIAAFSISTNELKLIFIEKLNSM